MFGSIINEILERHDRELDLLRKQIAELKAKPPRRERIASQQMAGFAASASAEECSYEVEVTTALNRTDALIAELDKEVDGA